jgi:hypothetical protein
MISESYKNRIKILSGILKEDNIELKSNTGRSDEDTLGWFSESYLLNLGSEILTDIDNKIEKDSLLNLQLLKSSTKLISNSLFIKMIITGDYEGNSINEDFDLVLTVQFTNDSNTVASINFKGIISRFNLNSKHSSKDLELFKNEIIDNIFNSLKISNKNQ